jgi:hypothetical protein
MLNDKEITKKRQGVIVGSLTGTPTSHSLLVGGSEVVGQPKIVAKQKASTPHCIYTGDQC